MFIAAIAMTFSLIAMLQFVEIPWFFMVLLAMHGGVFLFIFSKKRFKAQYIKVIAIFLLYNGVADTLLILFAEAMNWPVAIVAFLVSTGISFYIMLKTVAELRRIKHQQYLKLQQDAPVGKIRI